MRYMLILCLLATVSFAQTLDIAEILDANVFVSAEGDTFQLAGIDMPSRTSGDSVNRAKAELCFRYVRKHLYNHTFEYDTLAAVENTTYPNVHLFSKTLFSRYSLNEEMLAGGIGVYRPVKDSRWARRFKYASDAASYGKAGVWNIKTFEKSTTINHHRYHLATTVIISEYRTFDTTNIPLNSLAYRWSYLKHSKLVVKPCFQAGAHYLLLPFFKFGVETGLKKKWYLEAYIESNFLGSIETVMPFTVLGAGGGLFLFRKRNTLMELQAGVKWLSYDTGPYPYIGIGICGS